MQEENGPFRSRVVSRLLFFNTRVGANPIAKIYLRSGSPKLAS